MELVGSLTRGSSTWRFMVPSESESGRLRRYGTVQVKILNLKDVLCRRKYKYCRDRVEIKKTRVSFEHKTKYCT